MLFSTPYHKAARRNMTVFSSQDAGLSWQIFKHIDSGGSAYSALLALNDSHAGLVYESGAYSALTFRTIELNTDSDDDAAEAAGPAPSTTWSQHNNTSCEWTPDAR